MDYIRPLNRPARDMVKVVCITCMLGRTMFVVAREGATMPSLMAAFAPDEGCSIHNTRTAGGVKDGDVFVCIAHDERPLAPSTP